MILGDMKIVKTKKYVIMFNMKTGVEVTAGINGHPDPFVLDMCSLVDIGVMGPCLNNCGFCYQGDTYQPNMPISDFTDLIKTIAPYTNQVALGGRGDVNLHEDFESLLKICREHHIVPNYTTSGNNLNKSQISATKKYCGAVAVSDYDKEFTYSAINGFLSVGAKTNIHFVLSSDRLDRAIRILKGEDVWNNKFDLRRLNAVVFLLFKTQGKAKHMTDFIPSNDQLKEFASLVAQAQKEKTLPFGVGMDSCLINHLMKFDVLDDETKQCVDTCEGARMSCYVTPDMKLKPCSFGGADDEVSIKESKFTDVWKRGDAFVRFRKILKDNPACCPYCL